MLCIIEWAAANYNSEAYYIESFVNKQRGQFTYEQRIEHPTKKSLKYRGD